MMKNNITACTKIYKRTPYSSRCWGLPGAPQAEFRAWVLVFLFCPGLSVRKAMN